MFLCILPLASHSIFNQLVSSFENKYKFANDEYHGGLIVGDW